MWCVWYTVQNDQMVYAGRNQAEELRNQLNWYKPLNANIVD
jgi:hypothetical protein